MRPGGVQAKGKLERHGGLPAEVSSLVGRGPQIAAVLDGLRTARVVTLTGPGGCGKTRLAQRAATLAADRFGDGAWLVELASLTDPALVPSTIAETLGVPERDAANPMAGVVRALADRELLIVLDNCEHVLASAARVLAMLAGHCPRVRILTTSRERLDVPGEFVFPVPPLGLPEPWLGPRGRRVRGRQRPVRDPGWRGQPRVHAGRGQRGRDHPDLLAAGWHAAGPRAGRGPLSGARARAAGGPGRGPPRPAVRRRRPGRGRHRSLEALVSWSYELLGEAERRLLARLSVLRGGFDLEVAERVCGGEPLAPQAVAGLLADLAGRLLVQIQAGPVIRYSLLETLPVRRWPAAASGEGSTVHARLLKWALEVARSAEAALPGAEWPRWSDQLSADQANIRAALSWALGGAEPQTGRELAPRLARWWIATGRYSDVGQFLTTAARLPAVADPGIQARVLLGTAWSAYQLGDGPRAAPLAADGIACARQAGEPQLEIWGRNPRPAWPGTPATPSRSWLKSKQAEPYPARPIRRWRRGPRSCWPTRPGWLATWLSRTGTAGVWPSLPGRRLARKGSPSR